MPLIEFRPSGKKIEVKSQTSLFDAAHSLILPVASSCSGKGVCGRCRMKILDGEENLSMISDEEQKLLTRDKIGPHERISCLTQIEKGNCAATTGYW